MDSSNIECIQKEGNGVKDSGKDTALFSLMIISYWKTQEIVTVTKATSSHLGIKNHTAYIQRYVKPNLPIDCNEEWGSEEF